MFSVSEVVYWTAEDALEYLKQALPRGWQLELRVDLGYPTVELHDESGVQYRATPSPDPKILYLDCLGWLMVRNHKPAHPAWRVRNRDLALTVPIPASDDPEPLDVDPQEVAAVYKKG